MGEVIRVDNEIALAKFIEDTDGLHDALLHEMVMLHPGYARQDGWMTGDADLLNAQLIFQSQFLDIAAVRVNLKGVSCFRFDQRLDFKLEGEIKDKEIILYLSGKGLSTHSEIRTAQMEYLMLGKAFLGPEYRMILP